MRIKRKKRERERACNRNRDSSGRVTRVGFDQTLTIYSFTYFYCNSYFNKNIHLLPSHSICSIHSPNSARRYPLAFPFLCFRFSFFLKFSSSCLGAEKMEENDGFLVKPCAVINLFDCPLHVFAF